MTFAPEALAASKAAGSWAATRQCVGRRRSISGCAGAGSAPCIRPLNRLSARSGVGAVASTTTQLAAADSQAVSTGMRKTGPKIVPEYPPSFQRFTTTW